MKNTSKTYKTAHGALLDNDDNLSRCFEKPNTCHRNLSYKALEKLSLAELQEIAEDLGILSVDNKTLLIKSISKELKK